MRTLKIILTLLCVLFCTTPIYAGIEPFYKGEWGMGQQQIMALYDTKPVVEGVLKKNKVPYINYELEILGAKAVVQYQFTRDDKLFKVLMDITTPKMDGTATLALIDELGKLVVASGTPFEHCALLPNLTDRADAYIAQWINDDTFVDVVAGITVKPKIQTIYLRFWHNEDGHFQQFFDQLKAKVANEKE